jgi:NhaP-type Na+/H+ or K+/H+ antiporter
MAPVAVALVGTGMRPRTVGFLGWFGPRGLASIVFALMVAEDGGVTNSETVMTVAFVTVALSVLLHGLTAAPFADRYARWFAVLPRETGPVPEAVAAPEIRTRTQLGAPRA